MKTSPSDYESHLDGNTLMSHILLVNSYELHLRMEISSYLPRLKSPNVLYDPFEPTERGLVDILGDQDMLGIGVMRPSLDVLKSKFGTASRKTY